MALLTADVAYANPAQPNNVSHANAIVALVRTPTDDLHMTRRS